MQELEKIEEKLKTLNLKFTALSTRNSVRIYVETEDQAKKILENIDLLGLKREEVIVVVVGKLKPLIEARLLFLQGVRTLKFINPLFKVKKITGGISTGSLDYLITGTLAFVNNEYKAISSWHIYLDSKNVVIPGPQDGGTSLEDKVGYVIDYVDATKGQDISIADISEIKDKINVEVNNIKGEIVKGVGDANIGEIVHKYGRSSALTYAKVIDKNVLVRIEYENIGEVTLKNCYITESFAIAGDSGSLVLNNNSEAIGLVTAGNNLITVITSREKLSELI